jgi:hypothetical protein
LKHAQKSIVAAAVLAFQSAPLPLMMKYKRSQNIWQIESTSMATTAGG